MAVLHGAVYYVYGRRGRKGARGGEFGGRTGAQITGDCGLGETLYTGALYKFFNGGDFLTVGMGRDIIGGLCVRDQI